MSALDGMELEMRHMDELAKMIGGLGNLWRSKCLSVSVKVDKLRKMAVHSLFYGCVLYMLSVRP